MQASKIQFKIKLLLGSSSTKIEQIAYSNNCLTYVCGSYLVFYHPFFDDQIIYINHNHSRISCLAAYQNKYIAVGQEGKHSSICIYDVSSIEQSETGPIRIIWQLKGHKHSIDLLIFSPNGKYLVSISNKDCSMFIWENGQRISQNKLSKPVNRVIFDDEGDLMTIGKGHFKIWKFNEGQILRKKEQECWMIEGKNFNLGHKFSTKNLIDIGIYKGKILTFTSDGQLAIILKLQEKIQKWIDLMMQNITSVQIYADMALCSGGNSIVKVINLQTLTLFAKFPKPPPHMRENIAKDQPIILRENQNFPDCVGVRILGQFIATLYSNRTIFIWKIEDSQIKAIRSIISHQKRVNSVCLLEEIEGGDLSFFSTASQDNTLRIWHFYKEQQNNRESVDIAQILGVKRNVYCRNLTRIIYTDSQPIIHTKMYGNKNILCISSQQLLMYSLDTFELVNHFTSQDVIRCIDAFAQFIYLGCKNGKVTIFKVFNHQFIKIREIQFQSSVEQIQVCNDDIIIVGFKTKITSYSLNRSQIIFNQTNINAWTVSHHNIIYSINRTIISIYNVLNNKTTSINIQYQIEQQQSPKLIRSNSWLITILTNTNKVIIANFSITILYSQVITQTINDLELAESGQVIFVTNHGTIGIFDIVYDHKYKKVQGKVKKWFEQNDKLLIDGCIWNSNNPKSQQSYAQKILYFIQQSQSLSLKDEENEFPKILPNVQINYRKEDTNQMSVFNPTYITNQVKQIYQNMQKFSKNELKKNAQEIDQSSMQFMQLQVDPKPKRNFFGINSKITEKQSPSPPCLIGNLIDNTYQDPLKKNVEIKQNKRFEGTQEISFGDFEDKKDNLKQVLYGLNSKDYIKQNCQTLLKIYQKLHNQFDVQIQRKSQIIQKFNELSSQYSEFLRHQLKK